MRREDPNMIGGAGRTVWVAKYYRDRHGGQPVKDFIETLPTAHRELIDRKIDRLNVFGPMIPAPHSKKVRGKLRRLKADFAGLSYRVLYQEAESGLIVLLHIFVKKTAKIPSAEIELAASRWIDFERRMAAIERLPPRAVGGDAP
jgi:phage-related protein